MSTSAEIKTPLARKIRFTDRMMVIQLDDGRELVANCDRFQSLKHAP